MGGTEANNNNGQLLPLGEVFKLEYGGPLPERDRQPGAVPVIGSAGVVGCHSEAAVTGPGVVVGRKGSIGSVTWVTDDFVPIDTTYIAVPIEGRADLRWIYHLLENEDLSKLNRGTGIPGLNRDDVYALKRWIPCVSEQRDIAVVLDAIDEAIENNETVIAAAETLRQTLVDELLTRGVPGWHTKWKSVPHIGEIPANWQMTRLGDVAEVIGGSTPSRASDDHWGGAMPWVIPSELTELPSRYLTTSRETVTDTGMKTAGLKVIPAGSVLMTSRATIGAVAINTVPVTTNQGFQSLVVKPGCHGLWLYYCILAMRSELHRRASGSTFLEISGDSVRKLPVLLPTLQEQQAIAEALGGVDTRIEEAREEREALALLKTSAAKALLTGSVRVENS